MVTIVKIVSSSASDFLCFGLHFPVALPTPISFYYRLRFNPSAVEYTSHFSFKNTFPFKETLFPLCVSREISL